MLHLPAHILQRSDLLRLPAQYLQPLPVVARIDSPSPILMFIPSSVCCVGEPCNILRIRTTSDPSVIVRPSSHPGDGYL